ncbi:MAG: hypothetical protein LBP50_04555 [Tannerella sp.]|jgi:hypothetical protein|nr:hypothetical protein [Tannerella sp.]
METLLQILILSVDTLSGLFNPFFASVADGSSLPFVGGLLSFAFAAGAATCADIPAEVLAGIRRWHGKIDGQFDNLDNLVNILQAHQTSWSVPQQWFQQLINSRNQLAELIPKCRSNYGSAADRAVRNSQLKTAVKLCLTQVKSWAYMQYYAGVLTADDVHLLGFLLPGEAGGHRERKEPTDVPAEVKVSILNTDFIRVVIDRSTGENAALTAHGWPPGVRQALIVIMASDGKTEVCRQYTTRLHNDIRMPDGSHGKQFIIKAAFLKHVDDAPKFGPEPTFSMPLTTEDLAAALDRRHREDLEAHLLEIERLRLDVERLKQITSSEH